MTAPPFDDQVQLPPEPYTETSAMPDGDGRPRHEGWRTNDELLSVVQTELDSSLGWTGTRIAEARRKNLSEYFANPRGDERENRSQVVTRVTFEQVEWFLPPMMDMFASQNEVCRFLPEGHENPQKAEYDTKLADQETDTCNYVFRQNGGFMFTYTSFKDAAIQKNGVGKVWWEEDARAQFETYEGQSFEQLNALSEEPNLEIFEVTARHMGTFPNDDDVETFAVGDVPPEWLPQMVYDINLRRINRTGRVRMDGIPPEEFIINRDARGLNDPTCRFVGHRVRTSESNLIAWGFDPETVRQLPGSQSVYTTDQDAIIRASQDDSHPLVYSYRDDSERTIYVNDIYILFDMDGDGISEWWHVVVAGDYGEIMLSAEPVDDHPFVSFTPIPIPHRFYGLALADVVADLQNVDTTLWRQGLNSLYLNNEPMMAVLSQGTGEADAIPQANLDQLVSRELGGYVEEYQPNAIRPLVGEKNVLPEVAQALEVHAQMKERRTGISPDAMGINKDSISPHVYGAMVQQSGAAQRFTLYARIAAETFMRDTFVKIRKLLRMHQTQPLTFRLRGEWVTVNPTDWKEERDCTVTVGLGHGSRWERAANIQTVIQAQTAAAQAGLPIVQIDDLYNSARTLTEAVGFKDVEAYWTDPETIPPQADEEEEDPATQAVKAQLAVEMQKLKLEQEKIRLDYELKRYELLTKAKNYELEHEEEVQKNQLAEVDMAWNMTHPAQGNGSSQP